MNEYFYAIIILYAVNYFIWLRIAQKACLEASLRTLVYLSAYTLIVGPVIFAFIVQVGQMWKLPVIGGILISIPISYWIGKVVSPKIARVLGMSLVQSEQIMWRAVGASALVVGVAFFAIILLVLIYSRLK